MQSGQKVLWRTLRGCTPLSDMREGVWIKRASNLRGIIEIDGVRHWVGLKHIFVIQNNQLVSVLSIGRL